MGPDRTNAVPAEGLTASQRDALPGYDQFVSGNWDASPCTAFKVASTNTSSSPIAVSSESSTKAVRVTQ